MRIGPPGPPVRGGPVVLQERPHRGPGHMNEIPLCEGCGYPIEGLAGCCPECGRPVAESDPRNRPGSAWQRRMSPASWARANWVTLRHPHSTGAGVAWEVRRGTILAVLNCVLAAALLVAPWSGVLVGDPLRGVRGRGGWEQALTAAWVLPLQVGLAAAALMAMTLIECVGVCVFSRRKGARMHRAYAWQVCAHATVGWVLAAVLTLVGMAVWLNLLHLGLSPWFESQRGWLGWAAPTVFPAAGFLAGLLAFELMVYRGAHECRFAGRPPR